MSGVCSSQGFSRFFLALLIVLFLFSCKSDLDQLNKDAKHYVEGEVSRISSDWQPGDLMASVYPGVRDMFKLQTVMVL